MNIKDLNLEDLVLYTDKEGGIEGRVCKINSLNSNGEWSAQILNSKFIFQGDNNECSIEECLLPIPLTSDILDKNKFPYAPKADGYFIGDLFLKGNNDIGYSVGVNIRIDNGDGINSGVYYTFNKIRYVHELQHVLHLLGIDKEIVL